MEENRLLVLSGPTASGKTALALSLAKAFPLEIINADSMQVYRGMDIGTAKPTLSERGEVAHHLIDVADPDEAYDAGRFVDEAERAIREIRGRGKFPAVVGGTGMYIRALLRGLDDLPSDVAVRASLALRWEREGGRSLFEELRAIDPRSTDVIHPSDRVRVLRALETAAISGAPPSRLKRRWTEITGRYRILFIGIRVDREERFRRINARVDEMFRKGLVDEVRGLLSRGFAPGLKPMKALGYRHVVSGLAGELTFSETVGQMKRDTRRYAKRQMTWLSREPDIVWAEPENAERKASEMARTFLS